MTLARLPLMFPNNPGSLVCTCRCDQAAVRRDRLLFWFPLPLLAVEAHRGAVAASGHHVVVVYARNRNTLESEICLCCALPANKCITDQRVRVTAERLVACTRSEESLSSAFKVPKSCLTHCYCGNRLHLGKPPPCSRPNQDKKRGLGSHSSPVLQLVSVSMIFSLACLLIVAVSLAKLGTNVLAQA